MAPILIALDTIVEIDGPKGKRSVLVEKFMSGPGQTILTQGEIVTSLKIPKPPSHTGAVYLKHGLRRAMEIAIVAVAARISLDKKSNKIDSARIVLGAVGPTPKRVQEAEKKLLENGVNNQALEEISSLVTLRSKPITDLRGTANYRSELVQVLTRRAVEQAWKQVIEGGLSDAKGTI